MHFAVGSMGTLRGRSIIPRVSKQCKIGSIVGSDAQWAEIPLAETPRVHCTQISTSAVGSRTAPFPSISGRWHGTSYNRPSVRIPPARSVQYHILPVVIECECGRGMNRVDVSLARELGAGDVSSKIGPGASISVKPPIPQPSHGDIGADSGDI